MELKLTTNDKAIRAAFHAKRLRELAQQPGTIVIDELGLAHAKCRIDMAVIGNHLHGYEIKSGKDSLDRLIGQLSIYRRVVQKLTIIADGKHIQEILKKSPEWCGIIKASSGPRGGIYFRTLRAARKNPEVEPIMLAHLLWRPEVIDALKTLGLSDREITGSRVVLYELLCKHVSEVELIKLIKTFMLKRKTWRDHREPEKYDD
jgi:hypothetical protein